MKKEGIECAIGYIFKEKTLLNRALTHASKSPEHLERQEFLGDAVLGLVIAEYLYDQYPQLTEGDLSKMRANVVCKSALLWVSEQWGLADHLNVGDGERTKGGKLTSKSIAANAVESVIGAVFKDVGFEEAKLWLLKAWQPLLHNVEPTNLRDAKSELQELTQSKGFGLPNYVIQDLGIAQSPRFFAECFIHKQKVGSGYGNRKKEAELKAASQALDGNKLKEIMA